MTSSLISSFFPYFAQFFQHLCCIYITHLGQTNTPFTSPEDTIHKLSNLWTDIQTFITAVSEISNSVFEMGCSVILPNIKEQCYLLFRTVILDPILGDLVRYVPSGSAETLILIRPLLDYYKIPHTLPSPVLQPPEIRYVLLKSGNVSIRARTNLFDHVTLISNHLPSLTCHESDVDFTSAETLNLDTVKPETILLILQFHKIERETPGDIQQWLAGLDNSIIFELILAANYCDYKELIRATAQNIAEKIKGKTPEEFRKAFNIKNDFTPEEEEGVRRENEWCEQ
jgi:hypothetical protein